MHSRQLSILLALLLTALGSISVGAQATISISELSASSRPAANGGTELSFVAVLTLNAQPISFNFHWERSDGSKTAVRVVSVKAGEARSYRLTESWVVGPGVAAGDLWERLFVNSGNSHLSSEPIRLAGAGAGAGGYGGGSAGGAASSPQQPLAGGSAHPAYLSALSDLRTARALLSGWSNPLVAVQLRNSIREIEAALGDITQAAITDGKNIDDHAPIDAAWDNRNRFTRALELLNKAYKDIDERETNPADRALRSTALGHISRARQDLNDARSILKWL